MVAAMEPDRAQSKFGSKLLIPGAILLAGVIIAGAIMWTNGLRGARETATVAPTPAPSGESRTANGDIADDDPYLGNPNAPVAFVEFSDFQCPFCRRFYRETLSQIKERYIKTGKVKFVYRDFPISSIHDMAETYAEAGECAEDQGKFWPMHDKIFEEQGKRGSGTISGITASDVKRWARDIGLDGAAFDQCLDSGRHASEVAKDYQDGQALGVTGTPATFINGRLVVGAVPYAQFEGLIEQALAGGGGLR